MCVYIYIVTVSKAIITRLYPYNYRDMFTYNHVYIYIHIRKSIHIYICIYICIYIYGRAYLGDLPTPVMAAMQNGVQTRLSPALVRIDRLFLASIDQILARPNGWYA